MPRMPAFLLICLLALDLLSPEPVRASGVEQADGGRNALNLIGYRPWRGGWAVYNMLIVGGGNRIVELPEGRPLLQGRRAELSLAVFDPDRLLDPVAEDFHQEFERMLGLLADGHARLFARRPRALDLELHLIGPARQVRTEYTTEVGRDQPVRLRFILPGLRDEDPRRWLLRATELLAHETYHVSQWGRWVGDPISSEAAAHLWGLCARAGLGYPETWSLEVDLATVRALLARRGALLGEGPEAAGGGTVQSSSRLGLMLARLELRARLGTTELRLPADLERILTVCEPLVDAVPPLLIGLPHTLDRISAGDQRQP